MKVLVIEDDRKLASFLVRAFTEEGYVVDACQSGAEALRQLESISYELVVLDWMLPEQDGLSVCRALRARGAEVPILMLTARGEVGEKVLALDSGADDYLTKPFDLDELMARARALVRRSGGGGVQKIGPLTLLLREHKVLVDGRRVDLTAREFALLSCLARHAGRVVGRAEILAQVWAYRFDPGSNIVDVHVRHLREKLGSAAGLLETVRGQGYCLMPPRDRPGP